jgi:uncharacterized protein YkwD
MRWAVGVFAALITASVAAAPQAKPSLRDVESRIVQATNDFRRDEGRSRLMVNARLAAAAREFAQFMAKTGKYSHEADGQRPRERVQAHGYRYCMVAENISYQYSSLGFETEDLAARLLEGWKRSPGHRANMLDGVAVHTAVAVARSPKTGYYYAVQLFAAPHVSGARC